MIYEETKKYERFIALNKFVHDVLERNLTVAEVDLFLTISSNHAHMTYTMLKLLEEVNNKGK